MAISLAQPMRPAEIELVEQVNTNTEGLVSEVSTRTEQYTQLHQDIENKFPISTNDIADEVVTVAKLDTSIQSQLTSLQSAPNLEFNTSSSFSVSANGYAAMDIKFGSTKTKTPIVLCGLQHTNGNLACIVTGVTNQQFSVRVYNLSSTDVSGITINWLAVSGR